MATVTRINVVVEDLCLSITGMGFKSGAVPFGGAVEEKEEQCKRRECILSGAVDGATMLATTVRKR